MILWVSARTSSLTARLAFALAGTPGEVHEISVRAGESRTPEFLAINPKGQVPVLVLDSGEALTETPAILLALGEMVPEAGLLGATPLEKWRVMEWLAWCAWTVPGSFQPGFMPSHFGPSSAENAIREAALCRAASALSFVAGRLEGRSWAVGQSLTGADLALATLTGFAGFLGLVPPDRLMMHRARVIGVPALRPVLLAEGIAA